MMIPMTFLAFLAFCPLMSFLVLSQQTLSEFQSVTSFQSNIYQHGAVYYPANNEIFVFPGLMDKKPTSISQLILVDNNRVGVSQTFLPPSLKDKELKILTNMVCIIDNVAYYFTQKHLCSFDLDNLTPNRYANGEILSSKEASSIACDNIKKQIWIFYGSDTLYTFDIKSQYWILQTITYQYKHALSPSHCYNNYLITFGGQDNTKIEYTDISDYNKWIVYPVEIGYASKGSYNQYYKATSAIVENVIYLMGGYRKKNTPTADIWLFDMEKLNSNSNNAFSLSTITLPDSLYASAAVFCSNVSQIYVIGGATSSNQGGTATIYYANIEMR